MSHLAVICALLIASDFLLSLLGDFRDKWWYKVIVILSLLLVVIFFVVYRNR